MHQKYFLSFFLFFSLFSSNSFCGMPDRFRGGIKTLKQHSKSAQKFYRKNERFLIITAALLTGLAVGIPSGIYIDYRFIRD